jgi:hypothetical protein
MLDWLKEKETNNQGASLQTLNPNTTPMDIDLWEQIDSTSNIVETGHVATNDQGIKNSVASGILL